MTNYALYLQDIFELPDGLDSIIGSPSEILNKIGVIDANLSIINSLSSVTDPNPSTITMQDYFTILSEDIEFPPEIPLDTSIPEVNPNLILINDELYSADTYAITIQLVALSEIVIDFAGLDGVSLVFNPGGFEVVATFASFSFQDIAATIGLALRFSPDYLKPMKKEIDANGKVKYEKDESKDYVQIELASATLLFDADGNFDVGGEVGVQIADPVMIGDTGIILENINMELNLSGSGPRPNGTPVGWKGLMIHTANLSIPDVFSGSIAISGFGIGSGGVSGTIGTNFTLHYDPNSATPFSGDIIGEVFGMPGGLEEVSLTLQQNIPAGGRIRAKLLLPFFDTTDQPLDIDIGITDEGGFSVAVHSANGVLTLTKPDILTLQLETIGFSVEAGVATATLGGQITPLLGGPGLTWPSFQIKELSIDSRGRVSIDGGWIDLPKQLTMDFHGFALEVSKLGFGSENDGSRWIGFSGGLKLCEGLPMSGSVEGLRICWKGSDFWLEFKGAGLAFEIPNSIAFAGRVEFIEDPNGPKRGFKGGGKLKIIPSGLEVNAEVVIGKNMRDPAYTFFFIFLDIQLPAGIPLFSTGVSLYGLAGLFAYNMEPKKTPDQAWYDDWYKKPTPGVSSSGKWDDHRSSFALGAGVTLGTTPDNGYAVNAKTLLVLVLPGPILMIEGKAGFLQERSMLSDEPPFRALLVLDGRAGQFLLNIEAHYPTPSDSFVAKLISVHAGAEAFFDFNNPMNWHLFIGQRDPRAKRIRAEILSLFEANAYFMLYATRFEIGAWIGYDARWKFGPVRIKIAAWMDGNALVSWIPVQFKGDLTLFGEVAIKVFGIGFGLTVGAGVAVVVPTPYRIFAELYVKISLPWPLPDPKVHVELEWKEKIPPPTPIPLGTIGIEHLKVSEKWLLERYPEYVTKEAGLWDDDSTEHLEIEQPEFESPVIPLDAKVVISFVRPMIDAALVGLNPSGVVSPERVGDYEFRYRMVGVTLERREKTASSDSWETVASRTADDPDADKEKLWGSWLALNGDTPTTDSSQVSTMTKLMLFGKSPFEYARETTDDSYYDNFSESNPTYGMSVVFPPRKECFCFDDIIDKKENGEGIQEIRRDDVIIIGENLHTNRRDIGNGEFYLNIGDDTEKVTVFIFPEHIRQVELLVGISRATCSYYNGIDKVGQRIVVNGGYEPLTIKFPEKIRRDFNLLVFDGILELFRLCYITAGEADRFIEEDETANKAMSATAAIKDLLETEIFLPNSFYKLTVVTEAQRREVGHGTWSFVKTFQQSSYFQTADPPGIYELSNEGEMTPTGEEEHYPERGPLKDLRQYVSKVMPAEGSQAVYRAYDVGAEFNESYVETMYMLAGKPLAIYLYDSNGQGELAPEGEIAAAASSWQENTEQEQRRADVEWEATAIRTEMRRKEAVNAAGGQAMAEEAGHPAAFSKTPEVIIDNLPKQVGVWGGGEDFVLKPNMLYRAAIVAMLPQVVIPLTMEGEPVLVEGELQYAQIAQDGSNFLSAVEDNYGQSEPGMMVISDGQRIVVSNYKASNEAQPVSIDYEFIDGILMEALEPSEPLPEPRAVFSWSFLTSRFVSFMHHLHSFVDAAWDLRATLGSSAWSELTQEQIDELEEMIEAVHPQREEIYKKSLELFSLKDRPLPDRFEIQVLKDSHGPYGFLIESPEPIHWRHEGKGRVTLNVRKSENNMASPVPAFGPVKIINCSFPNEWIEILVQTDLDLFGYKIECIDPMVDSSIPPDVYYTFDSHRKFKAGTVVRINTHPQPYNYVAHVERKDIFIGSDTDVLNNCGETLRIIDATGHEIHRRQFAPRAYVSMQTVIASNVDGTQNFIFIRDSSRNWISQLPDGTYRFQWIFKRNAGGDLPILRRGGSTAQEEVTLEFNLPSELP